MAVRRADGEVKQGRSADSPAESRWLANFTTDECGRSTATGNVCRRGVKRELLSWQSFWSSVLCPVQIVATGVPKSNGSNVFLFFCLFFRPSLLTLVAAR